MAEKIDWLDLYIKDFGGSQIEDKKVLSLYQKKARTFYTEFLLPLYKPVQDSKKFHFSVSEEELTFRIMFEDLKKYHGITDIRDLFNKVAENSPTLTPEKIEKLIEIMKNNQERNGKNIR